MVRKMMDIALASGMEQEAPCTVEILLPVPENQSFTTGDLF